MWKEGSYNRPGRVLDDVKILLYLSHKYEINASFYLIKGAKVKFCHGFIHYFDELKQWSFSSGDFHTKEGPA